MPNDSSPFSTAPLRIILALALGLLLFVALAAVLFATESLFSVWERLEQTPVWFAATYATLFIAMAAGGGWLIWRLLVPKRRQKPAEEFGPDGVDREGLERKIAESAALGVDVRSTRAALDEHDRRGGGQVYVAMFGEISSGKSSLIRALMPGADAPVSAAGGSTREVTHYSWTTASGDQIRLSDVPGLNEAGRLLDGEARAEALRSHVVVFVCDGDLTRDQFQALQELSRLEKPMVLALNKADHYRPEELESIKDRLREHLGALGDMEVVAISAGGSREMVRIDPEGREERVTREIPPRVQALRVALQFQLERSPSTLEALRDRSGLLLAAEELDQSVAAYRHAKAQDLTRQYSRKAVVGALAAITPGTDLLIQGYLGFNMVKALCALYGVPARKMQVDEFLGLVQKHVGKKATPLLLAIAGNGFKAFPGVGTVAGGLIHAVAYGLLFDTLGRALAESLDTRGSLLPEEAAVTFRDKLKEDMNGNARRLAELVLTERKRTHGPE